MKYKWDWDKKELVPGEAPEFGGNIFILAALGGFMLWFINVAAPWLGHLFFGGFL